MKRDEHIFRSITSDDWKQSIDNARAEPNVAHEQIQRKLSAARAGNGPSSKGFVEAVSPELDRVSLPHAGAATVAPDASPVLSSAVGSATAGRDRHEF